MTHFFGRFVGKRDGQNALRVNALRDEPCNALRENASFSRTSASHHQQRTAGVIHSVLLFGI
jgi:hypothetical protein